MKIKKLLKKAAAAILSLAMCAGFCGCSGQGSENSTIENVASADNSAGSVSRAYLPIKREDGRKFKMAFVDIDPYNETFRMM